MSNGYRIYNQQTATKEEQQRLPQPDSLVPVSEGFVGDPWLFIILTLCHILHFVSHWLVLDLSITKEERSCPSWLPVLPKVKQSLEQKTWRPAACGVDHWL
jgi:hypothetical protein